MFKKRNVVEYCTIILSLIFIFLFCFSFSTLHSRKLFYTNEIFQGILIHVKAMCEVYYYGQVNRVKPLCLLDRFAYQETLTLNEFCQRQTSQMNATLVRLTEFIDQVAVLAAGACQVNFLEITFENKNKTICFSQKAVELEGISVEALADPTRYQRPVEEEEAEETTKSFLESKQNKTAMLRDVTFRPKLKKSSYNSKKKCKLFQQTFFFVVFFRNWSKFYCS